jgi:hypothetical protein
VTSGTEEAPAPTRATPPATKTGQAARWPMLVQGLAPAVLALALAVASYVGVVPLAVGVLGVQVFLILGLLALVDAPASGGGFLVAVGAAVAADTVVLLDDGEVGGLAGVLGLTVVAALLHQLTRKNRSRVTESLADTLVCAVVAVAAACLVAVRQLDGGDEAVRVALTATAAALLLGRVGDRLAARPMLAVGSTRGWPGLLVALGAGVAAGVLSVGSGTDEVSTTQAALLGLVVAATVAAADLAVDLGAAELRPTRRDARRVAALRPSGLLLPFAVLGPVALVASRLVLG